MSQTAKVLEIKEYYQEKLIKKDLSDANVIKELTALDIMTSGIVTIPSHATIIDAIDLFLNEKITALIVTDIRRNPVGVFTETDLARFERERPLSNVGVEVRGQIDSLNGDTAQDNHFHLETISNPLIVDWMTPMVMSVNKDDLVKTICNTLTTYHIHRVFVKDGDRLVGVISLMDITATLGKILSYEE